MSLLLPSKSQFFMKVVFPQPESGASPITTGDDDDEKSAMAFLSGVLL